MSILSLVPKRVRKPRTCATRRLTYDEIRKVLIIAAKRRGGLTLRIGYKGGARLDGFGIRCTIKLEKHEDIIVCRRNGRLSICCGLYEFRIPNKHFEEIFRTWTCSAKRSQEKGPKGLAYWNPLILLDQY
jgi:hypothetical protein